MLIFLFTLLSCSKQEREYSLLDFKSFLNEELMDPAHTNNSVQLLQIISDMELSGNISKEEAAYQRAMVYFQVDLDPDKAADECFSLLGSSFLKHNDVANMMVCVIISQHYYHHKQHKESLRIGLKGQKIAKELNDTVLDAVFAYGLIKTQVDLGTGYYYDELEKLIPVLEKSQERFVKKVLIHLYADEIEDLWDIEDYDRIITYGDRCLQAISDLNHHASLDYITCRVASLLSRSYLAVGKQEKAAEVFEQARKTQIAQSAPGCYNLIGYYLETYQLDEIKPLLSYKEDAAYPYTYTWEYLVLLQDLQEYYNRLGKEPLVVQTGMQMDVVRDSIVHREHHVAAEKATIISELKLDEMRKELTVQRRYQQYFIVLLLILLVICIYLIYRTYQEKKEKNRKIMEINELLEQTYKKQLREPSPAATTSSADSAESMFDEESQRGLLIRMDELIMKEKLYLLENVSREDMASMLHVDKTLLILAIRNHLNDAYMPVILNRYRVRHAIDVMKEQPNYTVEAIAKESGFNNVRKFYRIFKDEMGMTPSEYRELLKNKGEDSVLPPPMAINSL